MGNTESHQGRAGPSTGAVSQEVPIFVIKQDLQDDLAITETPVVSAVEPEAEPGGSADGLDSADGSTCLSERGGAGGSAGGSVEDAADVTEPPPGAAPDVKASAVGGAAEGLLRELHEYHLTKHTLGEGAFAKVRLATSQSTGHQVAVKIIKRKKLDERAEMLLQREVRFSAADGALPPATFRPSALLSTCAPRGA